MSKKGLVNKYLYGKDNKTDFTDAMLPARRREQFGYLFKNNYLRLFYLNLIVFIFFLPVIIFYGMTSIYIYHLTSGIDNSQYITELLPISVFQYAGITLLLPIGFIGLSGTNFIIRKMAFDEVVDIKTDFKKGIKYSYKQYMFIGFLLGLVLFAVSYAIQYLSLSEMHPLLFILLLTLVIIIFVILLIAIMYMANLSTLYVMSNVMIVKSGLILAIKELFKNLGVFLLSIVPVFIWLMFSHIFIKLTTILILLVYGFIFIQLCFNLLSLYSFDKYINIKSYPDFYRKGLRKNG